MNKKLQIVSILIVLISFTSLVSGEVYLTIDVEEEFYFGIVSFNYLINSDVEENIEYSASCYCPDAPIALLKSNSVLIKEGESISETYVCFDEVEELEPQTCKAVIFVNNGNETSLEKEFFIKTNPSFEFNLRFCKDEECIKKAKVFLLGEDVYVDYESDMRYSRPGMTNFKPLVVNAKLISPNGDSNSISLPGFVDVNQIGEYKIEIVASKEGYKTQIVEDSFSIIEKVSEIKTIETVCNIDGICSGEETGINCPQDCKLTEEEKYEKVQERVETEIKLEKMKQEAGKDFNKLIYFIILAFIIILIGIVIFFVLRRRKKGLSAPNHWTKPINK